MYKTTSINCKTIKKSWVIIDASNQPLGRLSSKIAKILRGKNKVYFTPHLDCGDNVIVINAELIKLSGDKWNTKRYISHTGYPGGQKTIKANDLFKKNPLKILEKSIKGMLPKNRLGKTLFSNLYLNKGFEYKQKAQNPKIIDIKKFN